ncbi:MAG TPA: adenylate/guanylate cyclase domain-containing protein [Usitatibacteraceae bacterium]
MTGKIAAKLSDIQSLQAERLSPEEKLSGDMLLFSTGLMMFASVLWLAVYWSFGQRFSTLIPLTFQFISVCTIVFYLKTRKLAPFCLMQLSLFLFTPFVLQWSIGNFVNASGVSLWALLAPVGAIVIMGTKESVPWFIAYIFMTAMSGMFDYQLGLDVKQLDSKTVAVFFVLNFVSISAMVYVLLWYFTREKTKLREAIEAQTHAVETEKELSERLLLNILPAPIADRLKRQETNIADGHADVTVMFADIVDFTHMSEEMSPNETVHLLNDIFSEFDNLAERYGIEKIKTVGDAYMAAGGLRGRSGVGAGGDTGIGLNYVDAMADISLEMLAFVSRYVAPNGQRLSLRIGLATGPVVAGVIGRRKFSYDLWGDTVNVASRMCSEAHADHTQVDAVTYRRLHNRYVFDTVQQIHVKGKGPMQVYNLLGKIVPGAVT